MTEAQTVYQFVIGHAGHLHGRQALIARSKSSAPRESLHDCAGTLQNYNIKGVREDSHLGLLGWLEERYPLALRRDIPSPHEMLEIQCTGRRIVSLLDGQAYAGKFGRHAGPYEFLLHDLEHAHKFFGGEFHGQVRFFNLLRKALHEKMFAIFHNDQRFAQELNYLMADMNSHPVHLLKYLKAIALTAFRRAGAAHDSQLRRWSHDLFEIWRMPVAVRDSALKINYPQHETDSDRLTVSRFFGVTA